MHGANASGRPFTGDYAGILLYRTLHDYSFSNCPVQQDTGIVTGEGTTAGIGIPTTIRGRLLRLAIVTRSY